MSNKHPKPVKNSYNIILDERTLNEWYKACDSDEAGPMPQGIIKMICALIEELAEAKDIPLYPHQDR